MNRKMMYASVAVVVIIVVVAVAGAYVLMNSGGGGKTVKIADATTLQFNADVKFDGAPTGLVKWAAKNVGATDMVVRLDILGVGDTGNYSYILNGGDQTAWLSSNGTWANVSSDFTNQWNTWVGTAWTNDLNALATNWSGTGDYNYVDSDGRTTARIYDITINPTLADSLFQPNA
jgi:hypothetical protein